MNIYTCQHCGQSFYRKKKSHDFCEFCSRACASRHYAMQRPENKRQCLIDGCHNKHYAKGYCRNHYRQMQKYGHILKSKNVDGHRLCSTCNEYKLENFENFGIRKTGRNGLNTICRTCCNKNAKQRRQSNDYGKYYYQANREKILAKGRELYYRNKAERNAKQKEWYNKNKVERNEKIKKWQENNRDRFLELRRNLEKKHRSENPGCSISQRISASMRRYLRNGKEGKAWIELVDFTPEQLATHIESLFKPGMTWDNRNKWHIDHIKPISAFNFENTDDPEFKECWSLNNLQPMWASDNIRKSNHYVE